MKIMTCFNFTPPQPTDTKFMRYALRLAKLAALCGEVPIGAIVTLDNHIIAAGYNQPCRTNDATAHAEIIALRRAATKLQNYRLPRVTLFTTLEPCIMCYGALFNFRVERVVFGTFDERYQTTSSLLAANFNHQLALTSGILAVECRALLQDFFRQRRKQH